MTDNKFDINDPASKQILVYNELLGKFQNTEADISLFAGLDFIETGINMGNDVKIFNDIIGNTMRFKTIRGTDGINITDGGQSVTISFDGDADTLGGIPSSGFLRTINNLADVDVAATRNNIQVYSKLESHGVFLEANQSNVPDVDNTYDLGSNGRRFANIFASTFHGTATESMISGALRRNGAIDGQILVWRNGENDWVPESSQVNSLNSLGDVDINNIQHESVLLYNSVRGLWETVPSTVIGSDGAGGSGDVIDAENIGTGTGVYLTKVGGVLQLRTLSAGENITIGTNFNNEEIVINAVVPETTDDISEGLTNLYYTDQYVANYFTTVSIQDLGFVSGVPSTGTSPVWNGAEWQFLDVAVDVNTTDDLDEGLSNLYYTEARSFSSIDSFIDHADHGIFLSALRDTHISGSGMALVWTGTRWENQDITTNDLSNISDVGVSDGYILRFNGTTGNYEAVLNATKIEDLDESISALYFNQSSFDSFFDQKTTDDISDTISNRYLNNDNLLTALSSTSVGDHGDVDISTIENNNVLIWDSVASKFVPASADTLNVSVEMALSDLTDVDASSFGALTDGQVIRYDTGLGRFTASDNITSSQHIEDFNFTDLQSGQGIIYSNGMFVNREVVEYAPNATATDGDILVYNATNDNFDIVSPNAGVRNLHELDDVDSFTILASGQTLVYDEVSGLFANKLLDVSDLNNVTITGVQASHTIVFDGVSYVNEYSAIHDKGTATDRDTLVFNSVNNQYEHRNAFDALDILYSVPSDSDMFVYDSIAGKFVVRNIAIGDASDVDITDITANQVLVWDGLKFVPDTLNNVQNIEDLGNVSMTGITAGQVLTWNGISLVPDTITVTGSIGDLTDVDLDNVSNGDVLVWAFDRFQVVAQSNIRRLLELDDVDELLAPVNGQVLMFDDVAGVFKAQDITSGGGGVTQLSELTDVQSDLSPADGEILRYSEELGYFSPSAIDASINYISELEDVTTYDIEDGQILAYNASTFQLEPFTLPDSTNISSIGELTDVNITGVSADQVLVWNGTAFTPFTIPAGVNSVNDLSDAVITNAATGDTLEFDGTNFVNANYGLSKLNALIVSGATDGQVLVYNGPESRFEPQDVTGSSLEELGDVGEFTGLAAGQVLAYNGTVFINETLAIPETIEDLSNVVTTDISEGQVLAYNAATFQLEPFTLPDSTNISSIDELTDVNITGIAADQVLSWDGVRFLPMDLPVADVISSIDELVDVNIAGITSGGVLAWDGAQFVSSVIPETVVAMNEVTDVVITMATTGDILEFDGSDFVNVNYDFAKLSQLDFTGSTAGDFLTYNDVTLSYESTTISLVDTLGDLSDVDITNSAEGMILVNRNGVYVFEDMPAPSLATNDLSDVVITTVSTGDTLEFDGTNFVNANYGLSKLNALIVSGATDGQVLVYNGPESRFEPQDVISGGASSLEELSDVGAFTGLVAGQVLAYNGTVFINETLAIPETIEDLSNVVTTDISEGQVLAYNAASLQFEPYTISVPTASVSMADITDFDESIAPTEGDVVTYDEATQTYRPFALPSGGTGGGTDGGGRFEYFQVQYASDNTIASIPTVSSGITVEVTGNEEFHVNCHAHSYPPLGITAYPFNGSSATWNDTDGFTGGRYLQRPLDDVMGTAYIYNRDSGTVYTKGRPFGFMNEPSTGDPTKTRFYQRYVIPMTKIGASHVNAFTGDTAKFADCWFVLLYGDV